MKSRLAAPARPLLLAMAALAGIVTHGAPASAQGPNLQLVPKAGLFMPLNALTDAAEVDMGLALGVAAELTLPRLPLDLRANLEYAVPTDIVARSPSESLLGELSLLAVVADVVLRPLPETAAAQPYIVGGAGIKSSDITLEPGVPDDLIGMEGRTTRFTLHIGGGVDVRFGPLSLVLEVSDYISRIETGAGDTRLQNDVFGMIGFRVAML